MLYRVLLGVGCVLSLSACQLTEAFRFVRHEHQTQAEKTAMMQQRLVEQSRQVNRVPIQQVEQPWVMGAAQPLARELRLPLALQKNVATTLLFQGQGLLLDQIAERITLATEIPVRVQPEALLAAEAFLVTGAQSGSMPFNQKRLRLAGDAEPLARSLDKISAFFDVYWRFEGEFIEFYKTETRSFQVRALSLAASSHASVGSQSSESQGGFKSQSGTQLHQEQTDELGNLKARLALFMTPAGRVVAQPGGSNRIVVSDTPYALDRIEQFIKQENQVLTRRVRLVFEEITISARSQAELNLDWNVIFNSARLAASMSMTGLGGAALQQVGAAIKQGPFSQTEAFVKAIDEVANVVRRHSMPVLSLNRRPVTHALRTTFSYVDKVETTPHTSGTGITTNAVSLSQKEETVGSVLTLVPDIQDDGQVLLSVAYDNTVAQPLKSLTVGSVDQGMQVQQVTIEGSGTVQQVLLRPGQPLVISGFDRNEQETTERRLNPGVPLIFGGGNRVQQQHLRTLIIITAQVEEGL
ncbi:MAG TPA: hypothetical protein GXX62_10440 [Alcaligenaceae bacterium]|nr:hypothetical protein [Alcaligenaceae bacterium]